MVEEVLIHVLTQIVALEVIPILRQMVIQILVEVATTEVVVPIIMLTAIALIAILRDILEIEEACLIPMDMATLTEEVIIVVATTVDVLITIRLTTATARAALVEEAITVEVIRVVLVEEEATIEVVLHQAEVVRAGHQAEAAHLLVVQAGVLEAEDRFLNKLT